jgi:hypothetical protein
LSRLSCFILAHNVWLAAVPPRVGFAGLLFGGIDSKPLLNEASKATRHHKNAVIFWPLRHYFIF